MVNKSLQSAVSAREPAGSSSRRRRSRGRPRAGSAGNVRERLLHAARELFLRYGYRAVSSRQIGAAAEVVADHREVDSGGKPGLYREILQDALPAQLANFEAWAGSGGGRIEDILSNIVRLWAANPWIAGFVLREVLLPGGPMRAMFLREFPERLAPLVERAVKEQMRRGSLRDDLDPKLVVLSIVSLAIFPFLSFALTNRVFGVQHDEQFVSRFIAHTQSLLAHGVCAPHPNGAPPAP